ncbi:MAG TPA: hypothetical protein VNQ76_07940 [Planctomicrobium sp.]|nr:hypothetical protein [Planctomicrobium sp.]
MPPILKRRDAALKISQPLPGAASTTVNSLPIDLQKTANGNMLALFEVEVAAPDVNTTMNPDTRTQTYSLITGNALDANGKIDSPTVLMASVIVQTGADGAGAPASVFRCRLPEHVGRYVALRIVSGASTTNASAVSATLDLLF